MDFRLWIGGALAASLRAAPARPRCSSSRAAAVALAACSLRGPGRGAGGSAGGVWQKRCTADSDAAHASWSNLSWPAASAVWRHGGRGVPGPPAALRAGAPAAGSGGLFLTLLPPQLPPPPAPARATGAALLLQSSYRGKLRSTGTHSARSSGCCLACAILVCLIGCLRGLRHPGPVLPLQPTPPAPAGANGAGPVAAVPSGR